MNNRKGILILGRMDESIDQLREAITIELEKMQVDVFFVQAKDGFEASLKAENQKFDAVIIDTEVPRLFEGGFVRNIPLHKNTSQSQIFVVSNHTKDYFLGQLESASFLMKPFNVTELVSGLIKAMMKSSPTGKGGSTFNVDVRIINAMIKSTVHVCSQYGLKDVQMQKPEPRDLSTPVIGDMASQMPIRSQSFNGSMIVSFDKKTYLQMMTTMIGKEQTEITTMNADGIGEINNIIFGNAKPELVNFGVEMTRPEVIAVDQPIKAPAGSACMLLPFKLAIGKFYIQVIAHPKDANAAPNVTPAPNGPATKA